MSSPVDRGDAFSGPRLGRAPGAAARVVADQRAAVRRRIHDEVAPALTAAALRLGLALEGDGEDGSAEAVLELLEEARQALHHLMVDLDSPLDPALLAELESLTPRADRPSAAA